MIGSFCDKVNYRNSTVESFIDLMFEYGSSSNYPVHIFLNKNQLLLNFFVSLTEDNFVVFWAEIKLYK